MLERTDVFGSREQLHIYLRISFSSDASSPFADYDQMQVDVEREDLAGEVAKVLESILPKQATLEGEPRHSQWHAQALRHVAVSTMQDKIRRQLMDASSYCQWCHFAPEKWRVC
jgi:hypothetical protein